jgi:hypothetical protein
VVRVVRRVPRGAWLTRRGHGCRQPRSRGADTRDDRSSGVDAGGFSASGTLCGEQRAPERSAGAEPRCGSLDGAGATRGGRSSRRQRSAPDAELRRRGRGVRSKSLRRSVAEPAVARCCHRTTPSAAAGRRPPLRAGRRPLLALARCRPLSTRSRPTPAVAAEQTDARCRWRAGRHPLLPALWPRHSCESDCRCTDSSRARLEQSRSSAAQTPGSAIDGGAEAARASASGCAPQQAETASRLSLRGGHAHEAGMRRGMRRCEAECS